MTHWPAAPLATCVETPLGEVVVSADHEGLRSIGFAAELAHAVPRRHAGLRWLAEVVRDWFDGDVTLETLDVHVEVTPFQRSVLDQLRRIPRGERHSYARVAAAIGRPGAVRAVGGACARNPIALAIPCHRVVRADGGVGGYAWGVERKMALLTLETEHSRPIEEEGTPDAPRT